MEHYVQYERLYADCAGESHFEPQRIALKESSYSPPAPPLDVATIAGAARMGFLRLASGWSGDWHPSPHRQWLFILQGELHVEASDGSTRCFAPGSVMLVEDVEGKGHRTRVIGESPVLIAAAHAPVAELSPA